jgi:mono/diheme cytochrome c family protein
MGLGRGFARTLRARRTALALPMLALLLLCSCRQDMHVQPKFLPLRENSFYPDGRSARPVLEGTIARGQLEDDSLLYTGMVNGQEVDQFPFPISAADLARGRERFNIFCSPCHSQLGDGNGMIVQRGFKAPPSYFDPRLLKAPVGHFYRVMTEGRGSMADYSSQIPVADRWRIAAYIRTLQFASTAKSSDLQPGESAPVRATATVGEAKLGQSLSERKDPMSQAMSESGGEHDAEPTEAK